jgi:hypothetical protein
MELAIRSYGTLRSHRGPLLDQVYLDVALREAGIHPDQRAARGEDPFFTVKMTGGPDGDVAGNMINILHREYGKKVKVPPSRLINRSSLCIHG